MTTKIPYLPLNDGFSIPAVGLGCWMGSPGEDSRVYDMILKALKAGYRHFDTVSGNEKQVGQAIRDSGVPRNEIYLTTKLSSDEHDQVSRAFERSMSNLDCEYIDLYLMHWPMAYAPGQVGLWSQEALPEDAWPTINDTWREMEKLVETGRVKSIGVSNFSIQNLEKLVISSSITPAIDQVECHPCLPETDLLQYCESKGIQMVAWSPLGQPSPSQPISLVSHPIIKRIASELQVSTGQALLSWSVQRGVGVIPKTENESRMRDNISLIRLPENLMEEIDGIHNEEGMHRSLSYVHKMSDDPEGRVFGWSYKQLGWNMTKGGVVRKGESSQTMILKN
ncbi:Aldo/keto reductase [Dendrothele bispora CBS 962.96]|uniref:Aldo/keto reductase n=1 Tax=Dendrothele bispora (strain CBS 962.96) TaxID=1314807 RepID=A0A4S8KKK3_DENBC|nr:Aldo/keto reductase [Dendrothele bispora CBS 962.96]